LRLNFSFLIESLSSPLELDMIVTNTMNELVQVSAFFSGRRYVGLRESQHGSDAGFKHAQHETRLSLWSNIVHKQASKQASEQKSKHCMPPYY